MVGGLKKTTNFLDGFRHQQTSNLEDYKYETAVLSVEKSFSTIIKCKNIYILIYIYIYIYIYQKTNIQKYTAFATNINSTNTNERTFRNYLLLPPLEKMIKAADCIKTFVRTLVPQVRRHILYDISIIQQILTPNSFNIRTSSLYR